MLKGLFRLAGFHSLPGCLSAAVCVGELTRWAGGALAGVGGSLLLRLAAFLGDLSVWLIGSAARLAAALPLPFADGLALADATALPLSACLLARVAARPEACTESKMSKMYTVYAVYAVLMGLQCQPLGYQMQFCENQYG